MQENIPPAPKAAPYTQLSIRSFLSEILDTDIEVVRLPELYSPKNSGPEKSDVNNVHFSLYGSAVQSNKERKGKGKADPDQPSSTGTDQTSAQRRQRERAYALPKGGGPFKGFAFAVLRDGDKAQAAYERWDWQNRGKTIQSRLTEALSDDEDDKTSPEDSEPEETEVDAQAADGEDQETAIDPTTIRAEEVSENGEEANDEPVELNKPNEPVGAAATRADRSGFRMLPM